MRWVLIHLPHILPPVLAFGLLIRLGLWAADQPPQQFSDEEVEVWVAERAARRAERHRPVLGPVARLGLFALTPLVVAFGTGLAIYTWNLRHDRPSAALVWTHTGFAALGIVIATVKVAAIGWRRIRGGIALDRVHQALASLVLAGLAVPLVATGVWELAYPSGRSFADYAHLIVSVWWTLLFQLHLFRYLGRALGTTFSGGATRDPRPQAGD